MVRNELLLSVLHVTYTDLYSLHAYTLEMALEYKIRLSMRHR